jgi:hypothetical protein
MARVRTIRNIMMEVCSPIVTSPLTLLGPSNYFVSHKGIHVRIHADI